MTMTNDDEEMIILDQLLDARFVVEGLEKQARTLKSQLDFARAKVETLEQAAIDYMEGNGLISTERMRLGRKTSIDVPDVEAIPLKYQRIKKEANKLLIKQEMDELDGANWFTVKESKFITVLKGE